MVTLNLGNLELKEDIHSADVLCDGLESMLGDRIKYCKGIVTDSPNVMMDLRKKFCIKHPHLANIRCILHGMNFIIHDFANCDVVKPWAKQISTLVSYFSKSHYWRNVMRKWGDQNGETKFLTKYLSIRWYSFVDLSMSVKKFRGGFQYCVNYQETNPEKKLPKNIKDILDGDVFVHVKFIFQLMLPFNKAISVLEREASNLGEVWIAFIKIQKYLQYDLKRNNFPSDYNNVFKLLINSLNKRSAKFEDPIYIVALFLTPQYRKICTSKHYSSRYVHMLAVRLAEAWQSNGYFTKEQSLQFSTQIMEYEQNKYPHHCNEHDPIKYWKQFKDTVLGDFALILMGLSPTSASLERLFSKLTRTKTKYRNRMLPENLVKHGRIKLEALNAFKSGTRKEINIDEELEWEVEELDFENEDSENIQIEFDLTHTEKFVWNMSTMEGKNENLNTADHERTTRRH